MALKDITVHMDNAEDAQARAKAALSLAIAHGAHLTGVYAIPSPVIPTYAEVHVNPEILDAQKQAAADAAEEARVAFAKAAPGNAGVSVEWRASPGDAGRLLGMHGRYADLLVVGQSDPDRGLFQGDRDMPDRLILTAGRPVMVLPHRYNGDLACKRILIAWDGGALAARAVHDSLALLEKADEVRVMVVNPDLNDGPKHDPGADIATHLARHGVKVEADHVTSGEVDPGNMLLSRAADMQADLMVMGAYGHARWSELLLGGVTNRVLSNQTLPVLMSH